MSIYNKWNNTPLPDGNPDMPVLTVPNPSDPYGMPIYEGSARNARRNLIPGEYHATTHLAHCETVVDVILHVYDNVSYVTDEDNIPLVGLINQQSDRRY